MPSPASFPRPGARVRRRTALGGLLALGTVAAGCTGKASPPEPRTSPPPAAGTDPDVLLAATVLTAEQEVLDLVTATMRRHRQLRRELLPAAQVHREHARLLRDAVPSSAPSPSGTPTGPARIPSDPGKALAVVARGEDRLNLVAKRSAFSAESGAFARILASMAAAAAQQSTLLRDRTSAGGGR